MGDDRLTIGTVLTWIVIGILAIVAIRIALHLAGIVLGIFGVVLGIAAFLLFTLGPIILVGWLAMKAWKAFTRESAV